MINAINSTTAGCSPLKQSFGQGKVQAIYQPEVEKAKRKAIAKHLGSQVVAGAIFSGIWDGAINLYRTVSKNGKPLISLSTIGKRAAAMGGLFALMSAVFMGIDAVMYRKKHNQNPMV